MRRELLENILEFIDKVLKFIITCDSSKKVKALINLD